jgi:hypothetical protein
MAVVSKWLCGSCAAQDVVFAIQTVSDQLFVICAACGATCHSPEKEKAEFVQMDGIAGYEKGGWVLATMNDVRTAGFESLIDSEVPTLYETIFKSYSGYGAH